jgi:transcription elongation GreA/GreB family factor
VSPRAPILRALAGAGVGDAREVHRGGTTEWVEVLGIR